MKGLRADVIKGNSSKSTLVVAWDLPRRIPDNYTLVFFRADKENDTLVFNLPGVSFLFIMTIIINKNQ